MPKYRLLSAAIAVLSAISPASSRIVEVAPRIVLVPDEAGAGTRFQMIVGAGCHDEPEGRCLGLAHYLEHLVMLGRNPGHADAAVRLFGDGGANGWTLDRATVYAHTLPARAGGPRADLERLFAFYAARLRDFSVTPAEAARERDVVVQELDGRIEANAFLPLERAMSRALLPDRANGSWAVGERAAIRAMTVDQARAFHRDWYHRNNVWFVVSGPLAAEELAGIAGCGLAGLGEATLPPRLSAQPVEVEPGHLRVRQINPAIRRAGVIIKKAVNLPEDDPVETRAARRLFGDFLISRLPGSLHEVLSERDGLISTRPNITIERLARGAYVLHIGADVSADAAPEELEAAILAYLDGLATAPGLDDAAVQRLQKRFANSQSDIDADARREFFQIGTWLAGGGTPEELAAWKTAVAGLKPEAVRAFAAAFAGAGRVVTGILAPPEGD